MVYSKNMLTKAADLETCTSQMISEFNTFCDSHNLVGLVKADHIGLKCSSKEIYESQKTLFDFESKFIYQSIISNRRISVIGLNQGLSTVVGEINYLELSDQKPDGSQRDQIDHLEVIPVGIPYDQLVTLLLSKGVAISETVRPHHTTHDIKLASGFVVKLSREILIDKIKREEML